MSILVVLTIVMPSDADHVRVRAFDRDVPVYDPGGQPAGARNRRTWQALVGIDLDVAPGAYTLSVEAQSDGRSIHASRMLRVLRRKFPTRTLRVDEAFVNPPAAVQQRIEQDAAALRHVWQTPAPERLWNSAFVRPVAEPANSRFGSRSVFNGEARNPHSGTDFMSPAGTP